VRIRLALLGVLALAAAGEAHAYPWPVKPFNRQHPIGGTFGDPRMVFERSLADDGVNGPGHFYFHNGVDIHARPGSPVYAIFSGRVRRLSGTAVAVGSPGFPTFQYYHLKLAVRTGRRVVARRTVLGWITRASGHVHLSEVYRGHDLNPLARGRLQPYSDWTRPRVREISFRDARGKPLSPLGVYGRVDVFADAYDLPVRVMGFSLGLPVAPAVVSWRVSTLGGRVVRRTQTPVDFRDFEPPNGAFWRIYGRGTYPNGPIFGGRLYKRMPGRYLFRLTPHRFDTRGLVDGTYLITVAARDVRGNRGSLTLRFEVLNRGS
jgi:murein DD-endopeptidase MepM/ murein hydrolase activator NlpD